jgi:hypothetical protein
MAESLEHAESTVNRHRCPERAALRAVEQRFRAGHSRIPLDTGVTLVCGRKGWQVERETRLDGKVRGKTWPSI